MSSQAFSVHTRELYNHLSYLIEKREGEELHVRSRIGAIDSVMRETVALITELAQAKLEAVQELFQRPIHERTFDAFIVILTPKLEEVHQGNVNDYVSLLSARPYMMEEGKRIALSRERKQELVLRFTATVKATIEQFKAQIIERPFTDLERWKTEFEAEVQENKAIYSQMLDSKTDLTINIERLETEQQKLLTLRRELLTPSVDRWIACQSGDLEYLQQEFSTLDPKQHADFINSPNAERMSLLHIACLARQYPVVSWLLERGALYDIPNAEGYSPVHFAAKNGDVPTLQLLCSYGADLNAKGAYGRTPLHMAAFNGRYPVTEFLIQQRVDINAQTTAEDHCKTALHDAVICQKTLIVTLLVQQAELNTQLRDSGGHTPFYHAIADGSLQIAALIAGHASWKRPSNQQDPDARMVSLHPRTNAQAIKAFLSQLAHVQTDV